MDWVNEGCFVEFVCILYRFIKSLLCMFGYAVTKIDFDWIGFVKLTMAKNDSNERVEDKVIYVWIGKLGLLCRICVYFT